MNALLAPQPWTDGALCAQVGGDAWFPEKGGSVREPKRICSRCPVQAECLQYAMDEDIRFGVWGGLSERERRALRKRRLPGRPQGTRQDIKHGTEAGYKAHRRRGEDACAACLDGNRLGIKVGAA